MHRSSYTVTIYTALPVAMPPSTLRKAVEERLHADGYTGAVEVVRADVGCCGGATTFQGGPVRCATCPATAEVPW